ncbi:MAG: helix-turn-helix transcriptional regulator [Cetobacterium sp.]|uniref:helix-turn-helix domain-containing protein n=1 Tax=Cetobacterium sp. TaxID=2071632 RepID=UPI002FC919D7
MLSKKNLINENLISLRRKKGLTQQRVAQLMGIKNAEKIQRIEHGIISINLEDAFKLACIYEVTLEEIYFAFLESKKNKNK